MHPHVVLGLALGWVLRDFILSLTGGCERPERNAGEHSHRCMDPVRCWKLEADQKSVSAATSASEDASDRLERIVTSIDRAILTKIFAYVDKDTRKLASLVCKDWHETIRLRWPWGRVIVSSASMELFHLQPGHPRGLTFPGNKLRHLVSADLSQVPALNTEALLYSLTRTCKQLGTLRIKVYFSSAKAERLAKLTKRLKKLDLDVLGVGPEAEQIAYEAMKSIAKRGKNLEEVSFHRYVNDAVLDILAEFGKLRSLRLDSCYDFTAASIRNLFEHCLSFHKVTFSVTRHDLFFVNEPGTKWTPCRVMRERSVFQNGGHRILRFPTAVGVVGPQQAQQFISRLFDDAGVRNARRALPTILDVSSWWQTNSFLSVEGRVMDVKTASLDMSW
eukprot:tig00020554_g10920.t1